MSDCKNIGTCEFIKSYATIEKSFAVKGYVTIYCKGEKQDCCKRKEFRQKHGLPPPDDMLPSGGMITRISYK